MSRQGGWGPASCPSAPCMAEELGGPDRLRDYAAWVWERKSGLHGCGPRGSAWSLSSDQVTCRQPASLHPATRALCSARLSPRHPHPFLPLVFHLEVNKATCPHRPLLRQGSGADDEPGVREPPARLAAVLLSALGSESLFTVPQGRNGCFCGVSQNSGSSWGRSSSGQNRGRAGRAPRVRLPGTAQATGRFPAVGGPGVRVPRLQTPRRSAGWACAVPARSLGRSAGRGGRVVAALREKPGSHHSPRRAWVGPSRPHTVDRGWGSQVGSRAGGFCS